MQPLDLHAHFAAKLGIEIGQRFIEQEHAGIAHQRSPDRNALALPARKFRRTAIEQSA